MKSIEQINRLLSEYKTSLGFKEWESSLFDEKVYIFKIKEDALHTDMGKSIKIIFDYLSPLSNYIITTKINAAKAEFSFAFQENNFILIECYQEFNHSLSKIPSSRTDCFSIETSIEEDIPYLKKIASNSLTLSRFHIDPLIRNELAAQSRAVWIENSCQKAPDQVLVAKQQNKIIGFLALKYLTFDDIKKSKIDLFAVDSKQQNQGVGARLATQFLIKSKKGGYKQAMVGTQAHNIKAIRFYEKMGFKLMNTYYSFHYHKKI